MKGMLSDLTIEPPMGVSFTLRVVFNSMRNRDEIGAASRGLPEVTSAIS